MTGDVDRSYEFEKKVKGYLNLARYSQAEIARQLGQKSDTFSKWVKGINRMPDDLLKKFCDLLKLDLRQQIQLYELAGYTLPSYSVDRSTLYSNANDVRQGTPEVSQGYASEVAAMRKLVAHPSFSSPLFGYAKELKDTFELIRLRRSPIWVSGASGVGKTHFLVEVVKTMSSDVDTSKIPAMTVIWQEGKDRVIDRDWIDKISNTVAQTLPARELAYSPVKEEDVSNKQYGVFSLLKAYPTIICIDDFHRIHDPELDEWLCEASHHCVILLGTRPQPLREPFISNTWSISLEGFVRENEIAGPEYMRYHQPRLRIEDAALPTTDSLLRAVRMLEGHPPHLIAFLNALRPGRTQDEAVGLVQKEGIGRKGLWKQLSEDAKLILMAASFFRKSPSKSGLIACTSLEISPFYDAIEQLILVQLVTVNREEYSSEVRYSIDSMTDAQANEQLRAYTNFEIDARRRWARYFINYLCPYDSQGRNAQLYWYSLSNFRLHPVVAELSNLVAILEWADTTEEVDRILSHTERNIIFLELVFLLAHYWDKLAHFSQRIKYGRKAANAAHQLKQRSKEAWLRIDTLGWTLMEEGDYAAAAIEITKGKEIAEVLCAETRSLDEDSAERQSAENQLALAYAFLARMCLKRGQTESDISTADEYWDKIPKKNYWSIVQSRIHDVGGQIAFAQKKYDLAIELFLKANADGQRVEVGESHDLGYAYIYIGSFFNAKVSFYETISAYRPDVTIEVIQAYLGLARTSHEQGKSAMACAYAQRAFLMLNDRNPKHPLIVQIEEFLQNKCIAPLTNQVALPQD